jgi:hypothetical protein
MNGQQGGDPAKLAAALVAVTELEHPPLRFVAGADAVAAVEQKARELLTQVDAHRDLSSKPGPYRRTGADRLAAGSFRPGIAPSPPCSLGGKGWQ